MMLIATALLVVLINIPFGYWRKKEKKYSFRWFAAIHLPVIFVIVIRIIFELGYQPVTYPVLIISFFLGQFTGGRIGRKENVNK